MRWSCALRCTSTLPRKILLAAAVSAAAVVAVTEDHATHVLGSVVCAALALPGVAAAQGEPGVGLVAFKWLSYQDWQPGLKRIGVQSPSLLVHLPLGERWGAQSSLTTDSVSGASMPLPAVASRFLSVKRLRACSTLRRNFVVWIAISADGHSHGPGLIKS